MSTSDTFKITEIDEAKTGDAAPLAVSDRIGKLRQESLKRFKTLGLPNKKQEEWRFTPLTPLASVEFSYGLPDSEADINDAVSNAQSGGLLDLTPIFLIFINGKFRSDLSKTSQIPSTITVKSFAEGGLSDPAAEKFLGKVAIDETHPFTALNNALFSDGLFIHVPTNVIVEAPIHILFLTTENSAPTVINPRLLVVAEANSQITLMETYAGPDNLQYLNNTVAEFDVEENAVVDHYRINLEGRDAFHMATVDARQSRTSNFSTQAVTFGGRLNRNDVGILLDGEGAFGVMNGLYQISGNQLVDNHTRIDHAQPNCETHELYKGILDEKSRGVFNGRIMVRQIAQKTDSKQTNRTLLLSNDALINTNPQLEIFADDVKCTHGATIGQINKEQLYYLKSRGISEEMGRQMLVFAFANDVVERIKLDSLRDYLENKLLAAQEAGVPLAKV